MISDRAVENSLLAGNIPRRALSPRGRRGSRERLEGKEEVSPRLSWLPPRKSAGLFRGGVAVAILTFDLIAT